MNVSARAGADLPIRGSGCVAADFNGDGHTDLYVTSAGYNVATNSYDALLWNNGDGTFTEGAAQSGIKAMGWHSAAVVGDVNGDGRPDLFVSSYTDPNYVVNPAAGFPSDHAPVRDLLYLNEGTDESGHSTFREVARQAGVERAKVGHGLGAVFTDFNHDGRLDLYVANDADPNQLYENVALAKGARADPEHLGFRLENVAKREGVADPNAGMGIAAQDFSGDGLTDLFVTNSRDQLHAAYRSAGAGTTPAFADARSEFAAALGAHPPGWGASWADLDLDGDLDLVLANGAIPVTNLAKDARRVQILENVAAQGEEPRFALVRTPWLERTPAVNGRGLAVADYDNDGDPDVAVNSIGGKLVLLRNDTTRHRTDTGSRCAFGPSRRARSSRRRSTTDGPSTARCRPARATSRRRIRECSSAWAPQRRSHGSPSGTRTARPRPSRTSEPTRSWTSARARPDQRPERSCSRLATESSVTASSRMTPVTM